MAGPFACLKDSRNTAAGANRSAGGEDFIEFGADQS